MTPSIYHMSAFTKFYAERLLEDVPDAAMADSVGAIVNHPAWQIAHVLCVYNMAARFLGGRVDPSLAWADRWGPGSRPAGDRSAYPSKAEMLEALERGRLAVVGRLQAAPPELLATAFPDPKFRMAAPTIGDGAVLVLTIHPATHWGQLSAWRRARGMGGVM